MGLLDFELNSSLHPVYSSLIPGVPNPTWRNPQPRVPPECPPRVSLECPTPECSRSAQPQSLWSAQPQSVPGMPSPESPWSAQPQNLPGVPNPRVSPACLPGVPNPKVSLPREGGDVRSQKILLVVGAIRNPDRATITLPAQVLGFQIARARAPPSPPYNGQLARRSLPHEAPRHEGSCIFVNRLHVPNAPETNPRTLSRCSPWSALVSWIDPKVKNPGIREGPRPFFTQLCLLCEKVLERTKTPRA